MWLRLVLFIILLGLAEYYSFIVMRAALRHTPPGIRTGVLCFYIFLSSLTWIGILFFRQINWAGLHHMVRNVFIAMSLGLVVGKLLIVAIMLIDEIRRLIYWLVSLFYTGGTATPESVERSGISRSEFFQTLAIIMGGTALATFLYGISNRYNYRVKRIALKFPNLPASFKGLKIVQISDVHSGSFDNKASVQKGIEMIMNERPDMILFTGDLVNNKAEEIVPYMDIFGSLKAPMGVYSILGNHDYGDYVEWSTENEKSENLQTLKNYHAAMGWRLMMNEHIVFERGSDKIALIGIENWSGKPQFPKYGDMSKAYSGLQEKNIPFKILISHDPSHWDAQVTNDYKDVDLTLSGHTHGMQFGVEIPGLRWSPVQFVYKKWAGLYYEGKQALYVNRGYGFLGYPGRIGILPEITVFEFS